MKNPYRITACLLFLSMVFYFPVPLEAAISLPDAPPLPASPEIDPALASTNKSVSQDKQIAATTTDFLAGSNPLSTPTVEEKKQPVLAEAPCTTPMCGVIAGQTVSGIIYVNPNLNLNPTIRKVAYYLNGAQSGKYYAAPFTWGGIPGYDTRTLQDGNYTLSGAYTTNAGDIGFSIAFIINNTTQDIEPPVISAVTSANVTSSGASVTWTTNELSDSQVQYRVQGTTPWLNTTLNTSLVTSHSVVLAGLNANTTYEFQTKSKDASGNQAVQTTLSNFKTNAAASGAFLETGGGVVMEGESFFGSTTVNGQTWSLSNDTGVSNGQGLVNGPDLGRVINATTGPRADFKFYVNNPGTFYVWLRGYAKDGVSDSLHVGLNGQLTTGGSRVSSFIYDGTAASWTNRNMDQVRVSFTVTTPGENTLNLWMREDGLLIDKILITQDANFLPTGLGPVESGRVQDDTTPPVISTVGSTDITSTGATITWTTDESSDSQVEYGLTTEYGALSDLNSTLATSHSLSLAGLSRGTLYHYRAISRDSAGHLTRSEDATFQTLINTAPVISLDQPAESTFYEGQAFSIILYGSDDDQDALSYSMIHGPGNATLTTADDKRSAAFSWTPNYTQQGVYAITLSVTDGTEGVSVVITLTVKDLQVPPSVSEIKVNQIDGDFDRAALQIYEGSQYNTVTYSVEGSVPGGLMPHWAWSYRRDGGQEILISEGSGTAPAKAVMDYVGESGLYEIIFRVSDDVTSVMKTQTTEVLAGTWASNNTPTLFLDFDGNFLANWGGYSDISTPYYDQDGDKTSFTESELTNVGSILKFVAERFSILGLFVTALDPFMRLFSGGTYATPTEESHARDTFYTDHRILVDVIGGDGLWAGGLYGGYAYTDSFANSLPNFVYVFSDNQVNKGNDVKYTAEAAVHEAGHAFGLGHQSLYSGTTLVEGYNPGTNGIAPIMGNAYYQTRGLWAVGAAGCSTCIQDDLAILSNTANGLGYRPDEFGDSISTASAFTAISDKSLSAQGVINNIGDADYLSFNLATAGQVTFQTSGPAFGRMLDLKLELYDGSGNLLAAADPGDSFDATLTMSLDVGTYYLGVKGHGLVNLGGQYGQYYDVGSYSINATLPAGPVITDVVSDNITSSGATITWTTDKASDSQVQYRVQGTTTWLNTTLNASLVTSHSVTLIGLNANTVYEYQVKSKDAAGNLAIQATTSNLTTSATFTWIYNGVGANFWSIGANWLGGVVPSATDTAVFGPSAISNCIIDTAVTVANISIASGYTGTIMQQANVNVTHDFSQTGGQWIDADPVSHTFSVGGSFSLPTIAGAFNRYGALVSGAYQVRDVYDLQAMGGFLSSDFRLAGDIDASSTANWNAGAGFDPVGYSTLEYNASATDPFIGDFDGGGFTVTGLTIDREAENFVGLFGATSGAAITGVGLVGGSINGNYNVGGLAGVHYLSSLDRSYVTGSIIGRGDVGGLVGYNGHSTIASSYTTGSVSGISFEVGGLVGGNYFSSVISSSYATGSVTGGFSVGGLVGSNSYNSSIVSGYATGTVNGRNAEVGGLVGINAYGSSITSSYAKGRATGGHDVGGLVGYNSGVVGFNESSIDASFSTGVAESTGNTPGGLIGYNDTHTLTNNNGWYNGTNTVGMGTGNQTGVNKANGTSDFYGTGSGNGGAVYTGTTPWDFANVWDATSSFARLKWEHVDVIAPVISAVTSNSITQTGATIHWTTNEASDSEVQYRVQGTAAWINATHNTSLVTSHSVTLTGLDVSTVYEFQVKSKDPAGNLATQSTISNFTTTSAACTTAMCGVTNGQTVSGTIFVQPNLTLHPSVRKVFYYLNGTQSGKYYAAPFTWGGSIGFDTRTLSNGNYALSGAYTDSTGDHSFSVPFTVNNT